MQPSEFRFSYPLRVRWSEADLQGIVFNGHYLNYADVGVTEYYRELNAANPGRDDLSGNEFFAVKTLLEYRAPAMFDDLLDIRLRVSRLGNSSMAFSVGIFRHETLLVEGEIVYVRADQQTRRPLPIPAGFKEAIRQFEQVAPSEA
ncbi:acyl-CoA thioesterase [Halopseudomonas sabulinigri]|uniref:Thioesterase family protein n=1 Tax=Halopseudomonas sabulinigri TaxID=472181 RepID=A0ABP9ZSK9_9GAMM